LTGKTRGSNRLLREGARLVECVEDVIEELAPQLGRAGLQNSAMLSGPGGNHLTDGDQEARAESEEANTVLMYLKNADKLHVDSIIEGSGLNAQTVLKLLLELELQGLVMQHPGKLFSRA
jgi:DNA processing protein